MRTRLRLFVVAMLAAALSGCWVLDELDDGNKKMDLYMKKKPEAEAPSAAPVASLPTGKRQRVGEYFASQKNPKTFTPGTVSGEIVRCKIGGATQFMKQTDCVNRGGSPAR
jgi:hypothetical protein